MKAKSKKFRLNLRPTKYVRHLTDKGVVVSTLEEYMAIRAKAWTEDDFDQIRKLCKDSA